MILRSHFVVALSTLVLLLLAVQDCQAKRRNRSGKNLLTSPGDEGANDADVGDLIPIPDDYVDEDYHDYGEDLEGMLDGDYEDGRISVSPFFV